MNSVIHFTVAWYCSIVSTLHMISREHLRKVQKCNFKQGKQNVQTDEIS
jgi:hypothetical protein